MLRKIFHVFTLINVKKNHRKFRFMDFAIVHFDFACFCRAIYVYVTVEILDVITNFRIRVHEYWFEKSQSYNWINHDIICRVAAKASINAEADSVDGSDFTVTLLPYKDIDDVLGTEVWLVSYETSDCEQSS